MLTIEEPLAAVELENETAPQAQMREAFCQDTLQAWGTHQETPAPTCHR